MLKTRAIQSLARCFEKTKPRPGTQWRANFFRSDVAKEAYLAWKPVLKGSFHVPERFGVLEFAE